MSTDDVTNDDLVIFYPDPGWRGGVCNSRMSLRTRNRNCNCRVVITCHSEKQWAVLHIAKICIWSIKVTFKWYPSIIAQNSLAEENSQSKTEEEEEVEENKDEDQTSNEIEEQQLIFNRRKRRNPGNRYAQLIGALL